VGHQPVAPIRTQYIRDALGRLTEKRIGELALAEPAQPHTTPLHARLNISTVHRFQYDPMHRLTQAVVVDVGVDAGPQGERTQPIHTVNYTYSALGDLIQEEALDAQTSLATVLQHQHDALGNRTQTRLPDGRILNNLHYGSGHLHQINLDGEVIADFERDE
jgi:hypothetical protein